MTVRTAARVFIVLTYVSPPAGLARRPLDGHALALQVDAADKDSYGLFPPQASERQDDRHVAQARLEVIERTGQPKNLRNAGDDDLATERAAPAGTQFERRIRRDDALFPRPCEHPPQHRGHCAFGASRRRGAVLQGQAPDCRVQVGKVDVPYPGIAENREDVDIQAGALFRQ